jgi:DME family drug/metabolite transporter
MSESSTAPPAIGRKRPPAATRTAGWFGSVAAGANVGAWSVLAAAVLWGTTGTAATFAPRGSSPLAIGAAAMGIGGIAMFVGSRRAALRLITTGVGGRALWLGAGFIVVYPLAFYTSMSDAGVAIGVTLSIGSAPIAAALIERFRHGRHLSPGWAATVAVAVVGATLVGTGQADFGHRSALQQPTGVILALVAGWAYAGYSVAASEIISRGAGSRATVGALFGLASLVLIPVLLITGSALIASTRGILVAGYLGLIPMTLGYVLFGHGLRTATASHATALSLLEPAVAAVLADLIADQHLSRLGWLGIGLVVASVLLQTCSVDSGARRPRAPTSSALPGNAPTH